MSIYLEATRFRIWAGTCPEKSRSGEWECDYPNWPSIYGVVESLLTNVDRRSRLTHEELQALLYLLARDNECEVISRAIAAHPALLVQLARLAALEGERDAKWQLAHQLGEVDLACTEVEALLQPLVDDSDEYVSRRALLAMGAIGSPLAEGLAQRAWDTGDEYQRIAALWALKYAHSELLTQFVKAAHIDGRRYVVQNAIQVGET